MKTLYFKDVVEQQEPCVATIGFFDGVHRGHQFLIQHVVDEARASGLASMVITFDEHPRRVLHSDYQPQLLSVPASKLLALSHTEVDTALVLHFDTAMASLTAREFMEKVLRDKLNVRKLFIGYDHRFGHNRAEGFDDYVRYGRELGIEVCRSQAFELDGFNVSSSVVRSLISKGEIELANKCLGYPYTVLGRVVPGFQEGRKLGFPTANIDNREWGQMLPSPGVYAVKARLDNSIAWMPAMANIGTRPTFNGSSITFETHIFRFDQDLYGQRLLVSFYHRIREERRFPSTVHLVAQLKADAALVQEQFEKDNE